MLTPGSSYEEIRDAFRWRIPARFNMGVAVCDRHAARAPDAPALICPAGAGDPRIYTFGQVKRLSNRLANLLRAHGLERGDRVGILLPQAPETAIAHIAAYKAGFVAVPLSCLFGTEALSHRLRESGAQALVTDALGLETLSTLRDALPALSLVLSTDGPGEDADGLQEAMEAASDRFSPVDTGCDDPAFLSFTSGTTGPPKGALHAHRSLLGHLPGVQFPHEFFPQEGDLFWTPADWAWLGGLMDVLMPSLYFGVPVLAYRAAKFDPVDAFRLIARHRVRNAFIPPTALKMMRQVADPGRLGAFALRTLGSGGETLGAELVAWGRETLGLTINEFYGQTECNLVVGNCAAVMEARAGSMGRAIPGHRVTIVDAEGNALADGEPGHIAVHRDTPVMFLGYWRDPQATRAKFAGDWLLTGDVGTRDADGYFWFTGRDDDVITSAGYRIGPGEIEDCLMRHPAVALAAVIGVPDPARTQAIKACIVLSEGVRGSEELRDDIRQFVRRHLAAHEYPRIVEFVDALPMTTTGKIMRRDLRDAHRTRGDHEP